MKQTGHAGHRKRLRSRLARFGADSLEDHEVLELLLFYVIRRRNTNPLAHRLIDEFGSLEDVLSASYEELKAAGLSHKTAFWLSHMYDFFDILDERKEKPRIPEEEVQKNVEERVYQDCRYLPPGMIYILLIDHKGYIVHTSHFRESKKDVDNNRNVCKAVVLNKAYYVVLAKTYKAKDISPSEYDCCMTQKYREALSMVNGILLDRFHVTPISCSSYRKTGAFFDTELEFHKSMYYQLLHQGDKKLNIL